MSSFSRRGRLEGLRPVTALGSLLILGASLLALAGCGDGSAAEGTTSRAVDSSIPAAFVLVPSLPGLPDNSAGIRGVTGYAEGFDRFPEYAKVARCGVGDGTLTWQLQFSANPPIGVGVALMIRDRTTGRTFRAGDADARLAPLERPEDVASGRTSFAGTESIADLQPAPGLADVIRSEDCVLTITYLP